MKFLIISLIVIFAIYVWSNRFLKKLKTVLESTDKIPQSSNSVEKNYGKILYERDDIIVLQGESVNEVKRKETV